MRQTVKFVETQMDCGTISTERPDRETGRAEALSILKMETVYFSETLSSTDESTRRQNPEYHLHHHPHRRENHKSLNKTEIQLMILSAADWYLIF
jgi:hypothetical protein